MKRYLEIKETLNEFDEIEKQPEFLRIEVVSEEKAILKAIELKDLIKNCKYYYHEHFHSNNSIENKSCIIKELNTEDYLQSGEIK